MKRCLCPSIGWPRPTQRWGSGFTLIELMVAIAVAAILITLATPSFRLLIQNNRISGAANDFVSVFNLARAEAIKRGAVVFVCRTDDPQANPALSSHGRVLREVAEGQVFLRAQDSRPLQTPQTAG